MDLRKSAIPQFLVKNLRNRFICVPSCIFNPLTGISTYFPKLPPLTGMLSTKIYSFFTAVGGKMHEVKLKNCYFFTPWLGSQ